MKRLLTLALALVTALTLTACNAPAAETVTDGTEAVTAANADAATDAVTAAVAEIQTAEAVTLAETAATAANVGLPDGYKLEVEQTGEKSGIIRLTDPNLQESYPTYDSSVEEKKTLYSWTVSLGDNYQIISVLYNGVFTDVETMTMEEMGHSLILSNDRSNPISYPYFYVDGKTLVWDTDFSNLADFSWNIVKDYKVRVINAASDVDFTATVPLSEATPNPYEAPAATAAATAASIPLGNTIDMPDGFTSNPGDAENFKPLTDDYIYRKNAYVSSTIDDGDYTLLVSFDESGKIVQFKAKIICSNDSEADYYDEQYYPGDFKPYIAVNGNILYIDYLAMDGSYSLDGLLTVKDGFGNLIENRVNSYGMPSSRAMYDADKEKYGGDDYFVAKPTIETTTTTTAPTTTTVATTTTTAATTAKEHPICGLYRAVIPEHEGGDDYDHIRIEQLSDGSFQVQIMPVAGGSGNDYVVYETEALGTGSIQSFTFDPNIVPIPRSVTITADGKTALVTYQGGEPLEYIKTE